VGARLGGPGETSAGQLSGRPPAGPPPPIPTTMAASGESMPQGHDGEGVDVGYALRCSRAPTRHVATRLSEHGSGGVVGTVRLKPRAHGRGGGESRRGAGRTHRAMAADRAADSRPGRIPGWFVRPEVADLVGRTGRMRWSLSAANCYDND